MNWFQMLLGWPFDIVYNGGQSGDTTQDCLDRLDEHCLSYAPDIVFMLMPAGNDITVGNGPLSEEAIHANQRTLFDQILDAGAILVALGTAPMAAGEARSTVQNMARICALNRRCQEYLRGKRNAIWINSHGLTVDPLDASGFAVVDYMKTTDAVHYTIPGALRIAKEMKTKLQPLFPSTFSTLPKSSVDCFVASQFTASGVVISGGVATVSIAGLSTANRIIAGEKVHIFGATSSTAINGWDREVLSADTSGFTFATSAADAASVTGTVVVSRSRNVDINPLGATTTGGVVTAPMTGTAMNGVNTRFVGGAGTAVASVVANADGVGNAQLIVMSAGAADDLPGFQSEVTSTLNSFAVAGETFFFEADLRIASANWANTPITEIMFRLIVNVDSVLYSAHAVNTYDGLTGVSVAEDLALHVRTPDLLVPAGTVSQFYWQVYVRCSGVVSSDLTLDLSRRAIWHKPS